MIYLYAYASIFVLALVGYGRIRLCIRAENRIDIEEWDRV